MNCVNEYRTYRKKMDSRRLTLDASLTRQRASKKDSAAIEQEVEMAQDRLDEAADETKLRMQAIKEEQEVQFHALAALLDAELDYFTRCKSTLEDLLSEFPTSYEGAAMSSRPATRPRAKSSASASGRSATPKRKDSSEEEVPKKEKERPEMNRARSDSASRKRISIMSSLGNIGNKGMKGGKAAASVASSAATKTASYRPSQRLFGRSEKKYANMDEEGRAISLATDDEDSRYDPPARGSSPPKNRQRSHSVAAEILTTTNGTGRRRALTTPSTPGTFVKVLFDFEGLEADELPLRRGQIVEVRSEVSSDWLIGEAEGMTGLFPKAFTEEYIPDRPALPALPSRPGSFSHLRNHSHLGGPQPGSRTSDISGGESDSDDLDVIDDGQSTSLASAPAPTPTSRSRAGSVARKAPPPPPSRRASIMSPPRPPAPRSRSSTLSRPQEAGPFGASPFSDQ